MVVDLPALLGLGSHEVDEGVQEHLNPGNHLESTHSNLEFDSSIQAMTVDSYRTKHQYIYLCEDEPDVDHLDIGSLWQAACHADEQRRQHQERSQVHSHSCPRKY